MQSRYNFCRQFRRIAALLLCFLTAASLLPAQAQAREARKTVRVGWYESPFNSTDQSGRRSGYAYEYQMRVAAYAGWDYVYVSGSWPDLMQMLMRGELDLLSDVSYTPERAERMLYPELSMGTEEYWLFTAPGNQEITPENYASLNGKRVGVSSGSLQLNLFQSWAERYGVEAEVLELSCSEAESMERLRTGELDAFVTLNAYGDPVKLVPVWKIGSSDFYFAINRNRPDLLEDLNAAMSRIQALDPYYNQRMFETYVQRFGSNAFLTAQESAWLEGHGPIRVGYQDNYLAFCATDPATGALTGALKDYLSTAADCFANTHLEFEAVAYPTSSAAMDALQQGEIDCVFPANLSSYDGELLNVVMTPPLMRTEIYAVVRQADQNLFASRDHVVVAVNEGNPNYDAFLLDHYPNWRTVYYEDTPTCLKAVSDRVADCVLISNYRYNNIFRLCEKYNLSTLATGVELDYSFAVCEDAPELYSVLSKVAGLVPASAVSTSLSVYLTEDAKLTLMDFISDNLVIFMGIIAVILAVILTLMVRSMKAERLARALIAATETDKLSGLYNRDYFFQYANRMRREHPDTPRDAFVVNIEQFHSINALNGRDFGDQILRVVGNELGAIARENGGIAGRFEADRFDLYCRCKESYQSLLERLQQKLDTLVPNTSVRIRMGVAPWQKELEPVQQFDHARTACTMARGHYQSHLIVFDDQVREQELLDQRLLNDLRRALDNYEFEVYYQPKYDIQVEPPRLVSAEALIRWQHPELGMIAPNRFIPLFERFGKISEVDKYVWNEAARQVARWRAQFGVTIPVSVNLSRVDVFDPLLEQNLDAILLHNGLDQSALKLEVTESAYTENADQVIQVVSNLRRKGYCVEMDDFGTGYSSLNMLSALPIDVLKLDRTFIRNMERDERDIHLVALILGIAKTLQIPVVAEGVETESQLRLLKELGCTVVQGYYFSRPLHPSDFESELLYGKEVRS